MVFYEHSVAAKLATYSRRSCQLYIIKVCLPVPCLQDVPRISLAATAAAVVRLMIFKQSSCIADVDVGIVTSSNADTINKPKLLQT